MKTLLKWLLLVVLLYATKSTQYVYSQEIDFSEFEIANCENDIPQVILNNKWKTIEDNENAFRNIISELNQCYWIRIKYDKSVSASSQLFFRIKPNVDLISVYVDNIELFAAPTIFISSNQRPVPLDWHTLSIGRKNYIKYFYFKVKAPNFNNKNVFYSIKVSKDMSVVAEAFKVDFANSLLGFMLLIISVVIFYQIPQYFRNRKFNQLWLGLLCLAAGVFLLSYSSIIRYFLSSYTLWRNLSIFSVILFPIGFFGYFSKQIKGKNSSILGWLWKIHSIFSFFLLLLNLLGIITLKPIFVNKFFIFLFLCTLLVYWVVSILSISAKQFRKPLIFFGSMAIFIGIGLDLASYFGFVSLSFGFSSLGLVVLVGSDLFLQLKHYNDTNRKIETYSIELQYKSIELENALDKFEKVNKNLEKKVEERTSILNEKNKLLSELNTILSESEIKYHQLADTLLEGIIIHKNGVVQEANNEMLKILGFENELLNGKEVTEFVSPASIDIIDEVLNFNINKPVEVEMIKRNGELIRVEIVGKEIEFASTKKGVIAVRNITENKRTALALHKSEEQLSAIFSNAAVGLVVIDKDGKYLQYNKKWIQMLGFTDKEMKQRRYHDIVYSSDKLTTSNKNDVNFAYYERRFMRKDSSVFWGEVWPSLLRGEGNEIEGVIEIIIDITDRKKAEEDLKRTENKYRQLFERAPVGIFSSLLNNRFVDANPEMARILGYTNTEQLIGMENAVMQQITENLSNKLKLKRATRNSNEISNFEFEMAKSNGQKVWLSVTIRVLQDHSGEYQIHGYVYDISKQKIAEKENHILTVVNENSPFFLIITDFRGDVNYISPSLCTKFGVKSATVKGKHISAIWSTKTPNLKTKFNEVFASDGGEIEISVYQGDNIVRLYLYVHPLRENNQFVSQYIVYLEDTLKNQNFEKSFLSSERILQHIASKARIKAAFIDASLNIVYVTQAFASLFGSTNHFMRGKNIYSFFDTKITTPIIDDVLEGKEHKFNYQINNNFAGIQTVAFHILPEMNEYHDVQAIFIYGFSNADDSELQLSRSRQQLELLQLANCGFAILTNNSISWVNHRICTETGFTMDEIVNRPANLLFGLSADALKLAIQKGEYFCRVAMNCNNHTSKMVDLQFHTTENEGELIATILLMDSYIKLENEISKLSETMKAVNTKKTALLKNISYEIRTPLNVIIGYSDLIEAQLQDNTHRTLVEAIKGAGRNLLGIINDILDLSRIEAGELNFIQKALNFNSLMLHLKTSLIDYFKGKPIKVEYRLSDTFPENVILDEYRIKQVLLSIINHSMRYTDRPEMSFAIMNFNTQRTTTDIRIKALNHGKFIGADNFMNYNVDTETTKNDIRQTPNVNSLGIALAKQIIEALNGKLLISYENGLIIITIDIPNVPIAAVEDKTKTLSLDFKVDIKKIVFEPTTILLVEDLQANIILISEIIQKTNLKLVVARNGRQTFEYLKDNTPDLILMDIMLPDVDGVEITEQIKNSPSAHWRSMPIIVFTATIISERLETLKKAGFDGFLQKPINRKEFYAELMRFLPYKYNGDEAPDSTVLSKKTIDENFSTNKGNIIEVTRILESQVIEEWHNISINQRIKDIGEFSNQIKTLGDKYNIPMLISYSEKLFYYVNRIDIEQMLDILGAFPELLLKLKSLAANNQTKKIQNFV